MHPALLHLPALVLAFQLPLTATNAPPARTQPLSLAVSDCLELQKDGLRPNSARALGWNHTLQEASRVLASRRVPVVGGLIPSPNIAAQRGDLDPARVARAFHRGDPQNLMRGVALKPRPPRQGQFGQKCVN
jgi:hypothetical protein